MSSFFVFTDASVCDSMRGAKAHATTSDEGQSCCCHSLFGNISQFFLTISVISIQIIFIFLWGKINTFISSIKLLSHRKLFNYVSTMCQLCVNYTSSYFLFQYAGTCDSIRRPKAFAILSDEGWFFLFINVAQFFLKPLYKVYLNNIHQFLSARHIFSFLLSNCTLL